jgi:hypothetical protein
MRCMVHVSFSFARMDSHKVAGIIQLCDIQAHKTPAIQGCKLRMEAQNSRTVFFTWRKKTKKFMQINNLIML